MVPVTVCTPVTAAEFKGEVMNTYCGFGTPFVVFIPTLCQFHAVSFIEMLL